MLYSEKQERSRRFQLALRMGIPILLLIGVVLFYFFWKNKFEITSIDLVIFIAILFISVYFLFFLINLGQSETYIDRMTGAFNRNCLLKILKKQIRGHRHYTIILLRIDNLSFINDHYGIDRADKLLRIFVHLLDEFFKLHDIKDAVIGRYHGGDFIVGVPLERKRGLELLEEFVSTYKEINHTAMEFKYALGEKDEAKDIEVLITHLYDTLSQQRNPGALKQKQRVDIGVLEKEIVEAVTNGDLLLHYIPTFHTKTDTIDLFEVGVKLKTAHNGILPPKKFIPVVNRLGYERIFDEKLFHAICRDAKKVEKGIRFSFNISPFSLRNEDFVETIKEIAGKEGVSYDRIVIELFENRAFKDLKRYRLVLEELRELGVKFALDNFGAPNASFEYIKKLPVDMVQFDRDFTVSYNNPKIAALLKGYIQACRNMGIETLVKWVDSEASMERFRQLGVDYIQGFNISNRPLDSEHLIKKYGGNR
ncbi:EAL domain-containing protein [Hydrogenimonas cancrithermarum]|uniref:Diguanylate cyclase/phosphodiesterase n=1 Tax=Hydrogenimonas cancrithermarum TaxID=2993563 RepID=A0ABN6WXZ4_9BACT|nr:GGDEF domain-containing protein [Hydrogenimonas cancrithermarum]BDY13079.1 hypothetical protein HCR_13910 [Hydrogenimonas cancrithermarum]